MSLRVEPLADHDLSRFACGNDELDEWLRLHARSATGQGTRTYVLVEGDGPVIGYFALAPHLLVREDAPPRLARGAPHQIPAILLAKLALDTTVQGRGLGAELLVHALDTVVAAARRAGGRVVLVDAIDDHARAFYEHHDFHPLPGQSRRLVMKLSTAAKALGLAWPCAAGDPSVPTALLRRSEAERSVETIVLAEPAGGFSATVSTHCRSERCVEVAR